MYSKLKEIFAKAETSQRKIENIEKKELRRLEKQINTILQNDSLDSTNILSGLTGLESKIKDIEASQENLRVKITGFEEQVQKLT